ncbi:MAG: V-type ATPase subunit [Candidatus Omnitrophica bacterium]|nr:V-type ATPase subunit [Candidatus Omnitrophota bacterium]MCM8778079.1 V-type ATPase subunit [Candidatus Omnitrophota bacterium]
MDILCVSGRIKSLEKKFLTEDDILRIVNAKTLNEVSSILAATHYQLPSITKPEEIYSFFYTSTIDLIKDMDKSLSEELYFYLLLRYDFHNLKLVLDNYKTGKESKNYVPYSSVDYFTLKDALIKNNFKDIPPHLKPLVVFVSKNKDMQEVLLRAKRIYWETAKNLVKTQHSDFIDNYIKIEIDLSNIGVFIQQQMAGIPLDLSFIVDGGKIKKERYKREDILWSTAGMLYRGLKTPITVNEYDIIRYNLIMGYIRISRVYPYGVDTIFSYFLARQMEMDNLKRLIFGKFYNIEPEILDDWKLSPYQYI